MHHPYVRYKQRVLRAEVVADKPSGHETGWLALSAHERNKASAARNRVGSSL